MPSSVLVIFIVLQSCHVTKLPCRCTLVWFHVDSIYLLVIVIKSKMRTHCTTHKSKYHIIRHTYVLIVTNIQNNTNDNDSLKHNFEAIGVERLLIFFLFVDLLFSWETFSPFFSPMIARCYGFSFCFILVMDRVSCISYTVESGPQILGF